MKIVSLIPVALLCISPFVHAESNTTHQNKKKAVVEHTEKKKDTNKTKQAKIEEKIREQMEREKKYAKEQRFYQGDEYDLKAHEVDPKSLPDVPLLVPDYDFDITDVYRDDI